MILRVLLSLAILLTFSICKKFEDTTPRYDKEACIVCSHYAKEAGPGKCFNCKATGVCTFCKGTGKRQIGDSKNFIEEQCPFCKGAGKCHYCDGSTKCKTCGGTGKYQPIQKSSQPEEAPQGTK